MKIVVRGVTSSRPDLVHRTGGIQLIMVLR